MLLCACACVQALQEAAAALSRSPGPDAQAQLDALQRRRARVSRFVEARAALQSQPAMALEACEVLLQELLDVKVGVPVSHQVCALFTRQEHSCMTSWRATGNDDDQHLQGRHVRTADCTQPCILPERMHGVARIEPRTPPLLLQDTTGADVRPADVFAAMLVTCAGHADAQHVAALLQRMLASGLAPCAHLPEALLAQLGQVWPRCSTVWQ